MDTIFVQIYGLHSPPSQAHLHERIQQLTGSYPWYDEDIFLKSDFSAEVQVGDGVDDEWFITGVLLQLTAEDPNLLVSVQDGDGQFLLIEAAEHLPGWLEPEVADHRVWLHRGRVLIIPLEVDNQIPSVLSAVKERGLQLAASEAIQVSVFDRVTMAMDFKVHRHAVSLPLWAAELLYAHPRLAHHAARHALSVKSCGEITDGVRVSLCFNRLHFARLLASGGLEELDGRLLAGLQAYARTSALPAISNPALPSAVPEDDGLLWLNVEEDEVEMKIKDRSAKLSEAEETDLLKQWTEEFERGSPGEGEAMRRMAESVSRLESFLAGGSTAAHEGIDWLTSSSDDSEDESGDEEFLEREVLEAIKHDPDLLMRICEMMPDQQDLQWLMDSLVKIDLKTSSEPQKGLADIDPVKLAEARRRRQVACGAEREAVANSDGDAEDSDHDTCSDADSGLEDVAGYTRTFADAKREGITMPSDGEVSEGDDLRDVVEDASLMNLSEGEARLNLARNLLEADGEGPLKTLLLK